MNAFLLLTAVALVSTAGLFAHRALAETTPLALAAWRLGLAALFFHVWNGLARRTALTPQPPLPTLGEGEHGKDLELPPLLPAVEALRTGAKLGGPGGPLLRLTLAGACLAGHFLVWFASLQTLPVARATLLVCTTPLWTMLGAILLGRRRFQRADLGALLLAAVGIGLVTGTAAQPVTPLSVRGDVLATSGGAFFAAYLLLMEGMHVHVPARRQVTATYTAAACVLWAALLLTTGLPRLSYSPGVWEAIVGMAVGPQILGHTLLNLSLRHFSPSAVAFSILLEPPLTAGLAWLLFAQRVTAGQCVGGVLVLCALALALRTR